MSERVRLVDVSLRDGLQDEDLFVATAEKARLAGAIARAGVHDIEVTSYVHPRWVPQLADADELPKLLPRGPRYTVLTMNERGIDRAIAAFDAAGFARDAYGAVFVVSASPRHHKNNNNRTIDESLAIFDEVAARARVAGVPLRGAVACAYSSPWDDETITSAGVLRIVERYEAGGAQDVTLADTVGRSDPVTVATRLRDVGTASDLPIAVHLHDSYGWGLASAYAALESGVRTFEAALAGLGGCPFAPGAPGNIDLERLSAFIEACGLTTGIDTALLASAREEIRTALAAARPLPAAS
jgi:hydroxymethylglutaryl-CoA lyase